jgi:hypothetical protein
MERLTAQHSLLTAGGLYRHAPTHAIVKLVEDWDAQTGGAVICRQPKHRHSLKQAAPPVIASFTMSNSVTV